jgi:hypothetical protein
LCAASIAALQDEHAIKTRIHLRCADEQAEDNPKYSPEIVLPTIRHCTKTYPKIMSQYGLRCSINSTFREGSRHRKGWHSQRYGGLDHGTIILMVEGYRSTSA